MESTGAGNDGEQIVTMVTDNSGQSYQQQSESTMSISTAMTGEIQKQGDKTSIKKVKPKVSISEYEFGKNVGQGAYGSVFIATEIATQKVVAIKSVSQEMVAKLGKKRHIFREKNLLNEMDNQFVIKLLGTTMVS